MKVEVDIPIPKDELDEGAKGCLHRDDLETAVRRLFDERHISSAEATHELRLTKVEFMPRRRIWLRTWPISRRWSAGFRGAVTDWLPYLCGPQGTDFREVQPSAKPR